MQKQLKILITDDSLISRNKIKKALSTFQNVELVEATDGLEALYKIAEHQFDCLLLDILMPNMNGIEVLQELHKKDIKIPTIYITADIQQTTIQKCKQLGAIAVLGKPFDEQQLQKLISSLSTLNS